MKFFTAILAISLLATDAASKAEPSSGNAGNTKKVKKVSHLRADAKEDSNEQRRSLQDDNPVHTNQKCFPPDCKVEEGTYVNPQGDVARWWAFVPDGAKACPEEGCPLFVTVPGTQAEFFDPPGLQMCMIEMVDRGFIGLTFEYANKFNEFGFCYGEQLSFMEGRDILGIDLEDVGIGLVQKAEKVFDPTDEGSIIYQVCDGPEAFANCNLGIAVQGLSQGSLIVAQATNLDKRISAALLWAVGDVITAVSGKWPFDDSTETTLDKGFIDIDLPCMDSFQLPPPRMRFINGDSDIFFGVNAQATIRQHKHMINNFYDCGHSYDCLTRDSATVPDVYTGGEIANEGGYFIVEGSGHVDFLTNGMEQADIPGDMILPIFTNPAIYGGPASFDWLAKTAKIAYSPPQGSDFDKITMELDLEHWRNWFTGSETGFFVEWADSNGVFGQRTRVAEGDVYQKVAEFSGEEVPANTIGFRLHAAGDDGAFLDQLNVKTSGGDIFKGLSFGANDGGGWCISMEPGDTWFQTQCYGDMAFRCIDFCTSSNGDWGEEFHFCDNNEVSKCSSEAARGAKGLDTDKNKSASTAVIE